LNYGGIALNGSKILIAGGLGLCEHCGVLLSIENMPPDSMNADWYCLDCKKLLTGRSFGYESINNKWEKTKWVGKKGEWVADKPEEDFNLGDLHIIPNAISLIY